jgi:hypothetical protein
MGLRPPPALPIQSRQDADEAVLPEADIGILSINDRVTHVYLHFVGPGRDVQNLRVIVERRWLSGLLTIDEYDRTRWGTGHDDLGWIRNLHLPRKPTAG